MQEKETTPGKEQGSVINVVLLILVILTLVGIGLNTMSNIDTKIAANEKLLTSAYYAADAGLEHAVMSFETGTWDVTVGDWFAADQDLGETVYGISIEDYNLATATSTSVGAPTCTPSYSVSSDPAMLFDSWDCDDDGYLKIISTGTINDVDKALELILKRDGSRISRKEW